MAFSKAKDAREAMDIAREMKAFLHGSDVAAAQKTREIKEAEKKVVAPLNKPDPEGDKIFRAEDEENPPELLRYLEKTKETEGDLNINFNAAHNRPKRKSPTEPENRPGNHRRKWLDDDKLKAAALLEKAKTEQDILDAAAILGRTRDGIMEQAYKGYLPIDHTRLEKKLFPLWKKVPFKKAEI